MPDKQRLIEMIQEINPTAAVDWLERFDAGALRDYLDHLQLTLEPRGRRSSWIRRGDSPPVVTGGLAA